MPDQIIEKWAATIVDESIRQKSEHRFYAREYAKHHQRKDLHRSIEADGAAKALMSISARMLRGEIERHTDVTDSQP